MRVRRTRSNQPQRSTAVLLLTGVTTVSRPEVAGAQDAGDVPAQPFAALVADQGAVAVAVGRDRASKQPCSRPSSRASAYVLRSDRLGVDRDEGAPSGPGAAPRRPSPARTSTQDVAGDAGVLVEPDPHPARHPAGKKSR